MWKQSVLRGAVGALAIVAAVAYSAQGDKAGDKGQLSRDDRNFITDAAQGGMKEVELGKVGQEKGQSDGVKRFGQRLVDDHSKANEELKAVAQKNGTTVPTSLDKKHQADVAKFSKMKAQDFDREYAKYMVKDHEEDIKKFRKQADKGQNADLKQFASQTVPTLEEHLKIARDLSGGSEKGGAKGRK